MKKLTFAILMLASNYACSQGDTMYVEGRHLYSAAGEKVVLRGMNEMYVWSSDKTGQWSLGEIAQTGANCVRLVWNAKDGSKSDLAKLIDNCVANKMIAIPECHDATGDWSKLDACINFWKDSVLIDAIQRNRKWALLNIGNEVGDSKVTDAMFLTDYKRAIDSIRLWGYTVPIMIDASNWGQSVDVLFNTWKDLEAYDPQKNVIFSAHSYWATTTNYTRIAEKSISENMPIIIGEGPSVTLPGSCKLLDYETGLTVAGENEIGWMSWSWGLVNNGDCKVFFDHTTNGRFGNWENEEVENLVVTHQYSLMNTAERPASMFEDGIVPVSGVYVSPHNPHLIIGDSTAVKVYLAPANAADKSYELSIVQTDNIVRFSKDSMYVVALKVGNAKVQAVNKASGITEYSTVYAEDSVKTGIIAPTANDESVKISPNPVGESNITVQFTEMRSGAFSIINSSGQVLYSETFTAQTSISIAPDSFKQNAVVFAKIELDNGTIVVQEIKM